MTESGKTTIAKRLVSKYQQRGIHSIVLDPLCDPGWRAYHVTADKQDFLQTARLSQSCALFVDESGEVIGQYEKEMFWLATRSRHFGHKSHFISQRPSMLSPTIRAQCSHLFCFAISGDDAKILANEWNKPELKGANSLQQFEYFYCSRFGALEKRTIT